MRWNHLLTSTTLFILCLLTSSAQADSFVYAVGSHFATFQVDGTITTDTNSGILSYGNFLDFSLTVSTAGQSETLTYANVDNGGVYGDGLTATATGLFFDYAAFESGVFFQNQITGTYLCLQTYGCDSGTDSHISTNLGGATLVESQSGNVQIGTLQSVTSVTPEPSSIVLLATGAFGAFSLALFRKVTA